MSILDPDPDVGEVSDADLMAAHVRGDEDAFTELVRRHQRRLWGVALRTMRNPEDAADALQDAFVSAYRNAGSFRGDSQVSTWLYRVTVNACLDRIRRAKVRKAVPLPEYDLAATGDDHARTEARLVLHGALAQLPEHQRAAIVLVDLHELSVAEAAAALGVAEGTVKSRCSRGRAMLAEILRDGNPEQASTVGSSSRPAPESGRPSAESARSARPRPGDTS